MFLVLSMNPHIHQQGRLTQMTQTGGYQEPCGPGTVLASWAINCHCGWRTTLLLRAWQEWKPGPMTPAACREELRGSNILLSWVLRAKNDFQKGQKQLEAPGESQTAQDGFKAGEWLRKSDGAWELKSRQARAHCSGVWVGVAQTQDAFSNDSREVSSDALGRPF